MSTSTRSREVAGDVGVLLVGVGVVLVIVLVMWAALKVASDDDDAHGRG